MALKLSPEANALAIKAIADGKSTHVVQRLLRVKLAERVTRKELEKLCSPKKRVAKRKLFKRTGAMVIREFIAKTRGGEDISDLQAVLENAVYLDCLRRYALDDEGLSDWDLKDVIKITNDYKKLRVKSPASGERLSGRLAAELLKLVEAEVAKDENLAAAFSKSKPKLIEKLGKLIGDDSLEQELDVVAKLQQITLRRLEQES